MRGCVRGDSSLPPARWRSWDLGLMLPTYCRSIPTHREEFFLLIFFTKLHSDTSRMGVAAYIRPVTKAGDTAGVLVLRRSAVRREGRVPGLHYGVVQTRGRPLGASNGPDSCHHTRTDRHRLKRITANPYMLPLTAHPSSCPYESPPPMRFRRAARVSRRRALGARSGVTSHRQPGCLRCLSPPLCRRRHL